MTAPKMPDVGPVGRNLIAHVDRLRSARNMSYNKLSEALAETGRPIFPLGLSRLERAERRVDVDELVALASVFGVTPAQLLAPPETAAAEDHPAVRAARAFADCLAAVVTADTPEASARARIQADRALRRAQLEAEELLDTGGTS